MAKYIINEGFDDATSVEGATSVRQAEGFFYFTDTQKVAVFVQNANSVRSIKRTA